MAWRAKPHTQVEGIWHSVHFLGVAGLQEPPEAIDYFRSTSLSVTQLGELNAASELEEGSLVPLILCKVEYKAVMLYFLFWWLSRENPELKCIMKPTCHCYSSVEQASLASY